ncbi:MAG: ATP-binding protein [Bdellovibrionales bacterium]|nr:ATP-binding protein [Bdellovibrionales bacterium]
MVIEDTRSRKAEGLKPLVYEPYEYQTPCKCLESKLRRERRERSGIPPKYELANLKEFRTDIYKRPDSRERAAVVKEFATKVVRRFEDLMNSGVDSIGLYLYSDEKGSGKTFTACALANHLIAAAGLETRFHVVEELLEDIRSTYNNNNERTRAQIMDELKRVDLLVLDEIGIGSESRFVTRTLYELIDYRKNHRKMTVFTSNLRVDQLESAYIGDDGRIGRRIQEMTNQLDFPEENVTPAENRKDTSEVFKILGMGDKSE